MFTGLIEGTGIVRALRRQGVDASVTIAPRFDIGECSIGESVAVDGVCLTITGFESGAFKAYVSSETLSRSTLGMLSGGAEVNLERALKLSDRLGGHLVLGHVDGMGVITGKFSRNKSWVLKVGMATELFRYVIEKGSIALDGVSLTVNRCGHDFFEVNVIPQTGGETTLLSKRVGGKVNIEVDLVGKYIEKLLSPSLRPRNADTGDSRLEKLLES